MVPRGDIESVVHDEVLYTASELNEFVNSFKQKSGNKSRDGFLRVCGTMVERT